VGRGSAGGGGGGGPAVHDQRFRLRAVQVPAGGSAPRSSARTMAGAQPAHIAVTPPFRVDHPSGDGGSGFGRPPSTALPPHRNTDKDIC